MATPVAAATEAVAQQVPRRFGTKQIFLPNHVIAFIRPKPKQPPNLATFAVPLQFNKLDLRDYLYHVYNVEVTSVRSFVNQPLPRRKFQTTGKWYRPRSKKMMIAELVKPFVWPDPPKHEDLKEFDIDVFETLDKERSDHLDFQRDPTKIPLRTKTPTPIDRRALRKDAAKILETGEWSSGRLDDGEWTEVEKDVKI
ncbi:hypothetical protein MYCTH_2086470 [Thermothelomyces thermophilus ATCC 42464]|uniref:Large ribosomal subunit protein uL23m n=1 Tax=Thermothelomyces thermophilus (strain ATCC 42464 / BCRC 31852 / DSM 1799) TaxID=573729 RepID=G2Q3W3_THET4|nr:uncharacterized protein MYCTH_2086470 [Thermothelomyces thermophilus ATCC 42464]AEO55266.1 hypothetical protein MYCTH_2086470 [Thermothelomyces thermophilus ATCC 42464]